MCEKDNLGNVHVFAFMVTYDGSEYVMFYDCDYACGMDRCRQYARDYECLCDGFTAKSEWVWDGYWPEEYWEDHRYDEQTGFVCDLKD